MGSLQRILTDLRKGGEGEDALRDYVELEVRDLTGEAFSRFMREVYDSIHARIRSPDQHDRQVGVLAIRELITVKIGHSTDVSKIGTFARYLREMFRADNDAATLRLAAETLGRLVAAGGALTADVVEQEIRIALDWLRMERSEQLRYAAVLILRQMAANAPAVFNVFVRHFIDVIWAGLRDSKLLVREAATDALRECLCLVEKRETRYRVQWYYRLFEETQRGLTRAPTLDAVHGSLLALGELLRHTGEFMLARYREVVTTVLAYRDAKEKLVRRAAIALLPRLAAFAPERFAATYLPVSTAHLLSILKTPAERGVSFVALGDMATALARAGCQEGMSHCLPAVAAQIKEAIAGPHGKGKPRAHFPEALNCAGVLARALRGAWRPHMRGLVEPMIMTGLTDALVRALRDVVEALPELLPPVQTALLDLLALVLAGRTFRRDVAPPHRQLLVQAITSGELHGAPLTRLALETLGGFNFGPAPLLPFAAEHVLPYLDEPDVSIRKAAALAAARILSRSAQEDASKPLRQLAHGRVADAVVERLLGAAITDAAVSVRRQVLRALERNAALDPLLAQADCVRPLLVALNDEDVRVRGLAVDLAGRLGHVNPAVVLPALRRHLMQLLADLEHSPDSRQREESAFLLGKLIHGAPRLVLPYVAPIEKALVAKLRSATLLPPPLVAPAGPTAKPAKAVAGEAEVASSVLATVGELAAVAGPALRPHMAGLLPLIIDAVQDPSASALRATGVITLSQVCESTGVVVAPYMDYPQLLGVLLRLLGEAGDGGGKRAVLRLLGVLGALDPHMHKVNQANLKGEGKLEMEGVRPQRYPTASGLAATGEPHTFGAVLEEEAAEEVLPAAGLVTASADYYPTVAINALMRTLRDPVMAPHHAEVVRALFYIFTALGLSSVPYLPKVMPVLFAVVRSADEALRLFLLKRLAGLLSVLRQHLRRWLPDLVGLLHDFWGAGPGVLPVLLELVAELATSLRDDIRSYLPELLPRFLHLFAEAERSGNYNIIEPALASLEALGPALENHLQLLLPALVRLICPGANATPLEVRRAGLRSMRRMLPRMQLAGRTSAIMHPLVRVLDGPAEELRREALDTICSLALALGPDFAVFFPAIQKVVAAHRMRHPRFVRLAAKMARESPPCMADDGDWRSGNGWLDEADVPESDASLDTSPMPDFTPPNMDALRVDEAALRRAWESSQRSTKEDWAEWMRHFAVELLRHSPSPALRATYPLAQMQPGMARELFAAAFVSCWAELDPGPQEALVRSLEAALASPSIPPETVTTLLNLAEFMEHDEKALPLDTRTLGALAEKCHAFAKALHYKELEFGTAPQAAVEALISINNQLRQPEAAVGVLTVAQRSLAMDLKESWYEKLQRWDEALEAYEKKYRASVPGSAAAVEAALGRLRCLAALAEWDRLSSLARQEWHRVDPQVRREMAPIAAAGAWNMGQWDAMQQYVAAIEPRRAPSTSATAFLRAVLDVHNRDFRNARANVDHARELLGTELAALVGESYERAYGDMVRVQQLTELEEVIRYSQLHADYDQQTADMWAALTRETWRARLRGVQRNVEVWQALLSVRSLVLPPAQDVHTYLKFSSLCRKSGRVRQSRRVLVELLHYDPLAVHEPGAAGYGAGSGAPDVMFGFLKHLWHTGEQQQALFRLRDLVHEVDQLPAESGNTSPLPQVQGRLNSALAASNRQPVHAYRAPLLARVHLRLGLWSWTAEELDEQLIEEVLGHLRTATDTASGWAKSWHHWGLFNLALLGHHAANREPAKAQQHVAPAVVGFFRSVALGQMEGAGSGDNLQDILRILTLWFNHGAAADVEAALQDGFSRVSIDTWLVVIPQMIARIHTAVVPVRRMIHGLLIRIGRHHPQALMYPLLVACKSQSTSRRAAAMAVVDNVRLHSATLVQQAQLVSQELIRMAILWHEMWHEALEEASRLYFGESNVAGMLAVLTPLHEMMDKMGATTLKEIAFVQAYGRELAEAGEWCRKYRASRKDSDLHQAWDLYYHVFKRINKQLPSLTTLELQYVSPALVRAEGLELAVPGTYLIGEPVVTIAAFAQQLHVITSKQRPRKLTIHGSDGAEYMFLLKGHEDLRQDERVMQLFGLVNTMLANDRATAERDLSIARYAVIPLSPNSGLIGWVPNTDTLHALIREYRDARKVPLNVEHRLMLGLAPDYDHLTVIQKVEVFEHALESTSGEDLHRVMWLKSRSSEVWLERRTAYTRATGVMSMVGYLLGLGDRHPSNLMLDRYSGKLLHIDFGDCFEASMHREKFPEKVPFRLTRMMVKAMEVSGIEGNFRHSCEETMRVLRGNKESVIAMLEAFVHDPLINWRLLNTTDAADTTAIDAQLNSMQDATNISLLDGSTDAAAATRGLGPVTTQQNGIPGGAAPHVNIGMGVGADMPDMPSPPNREARERELLTAVGDLGDAREVLNERAIAVMSRMSDKLTGRDFPAELRNRADHDTIPVQVERLIRSATLPENLSASYIGWCPFW